MLSIFFPFFKCTCNIVIWVDFMYCIHKVSLQENFHVLICEGQTMYVFCSLVLCNFSHVGINFVLSIAV